MELLFIQSQEHSQLPQAELKAVSESEGIKGNIKRITNGLILLENIDKKNIDNYYKTFVKRLAYTHEIHEIIKIFNLKDLEENILKINWKKIINKTFAVRAKRFETNIDTPYIERKVGSLILKTINNKDNIKVKLNKPNTIIRIVIYKNKVYLAIEKYKLNKKHFQEIKPHKRPFFHPGSMSPKLARCMVNLSRVKENDLLLDPFCGTGGILIEAGFIGCKVIGSDINWKMKNGTKINLDYYKISDYKIFNVDIRELKMYEKVDSVVTDPPYGISTSTGDINRDKIFEEFLSNIYNNMKDDAYLCMASPHYIDLHTIIKKIGFKILEQYPIKMHRSLTRIITVIKKDI